MNLKRFSIACMRHYASFANNYVDDLSLSKDIVQKVFLKIWEDQIVFHDRKKIDEFFYTAVRNKSLDYLGSKYAEDFKAYPTEGLKTWQKEDYFITGNYHLGYFSCYSKCT